MVADLALKKKTNKNKKKTDNQIRQLGKAFEQNFTTNQFPKFKCRKGCWRESWSVELIDA